ncbi:MAG TPA: DUF2225 domain-containing protein [Chondromyces sp.]|nr:DUF2225 domain-containing protein [Chondromyces sp.]
MENLSPYYEKQEQCLLCHQPFTSTKIRSRFIKIIRYDSDLRPIYKNQEINPLFYTAKVCPGCGFSYTDEFIKYFPPNVKDDLIKKVCSNWIPQDYGQARTRQQAINSYKLAAYCAALKHEKHLTIAGIALRTAWLYRDEENEEQERRFLSIAAKQYEEAYSKENITSTRMSEVKVLYLMAELNRRTGDHAKTISYLSKVIQKQHHSTEKPIIEMARDLWHELRSR